MIPAEIIQRKRDGKALTVDELRFFIRGYTDGTLPDYQMSALLMAIFFKGMDYREISVLTELMLTSGERMDFSHLKAYRADKHSTGGVGDKVSIILGPLLAAAGLAIPMISGRGLGHTGGTLDKLETIPGFRTGLSLDEFRQAVETIGIAMIGQTADICPADKKIYALRDVTGTVQSIPLICGSIMSKKIAEGIQGLVLDIKTGNGAFMKTAEQARKLADHLVRIGQDFGVKTDPVFTSMNQPLGRFAGLWCEMLESFDCLRGHGPADTMEVTYILGSKLLLQAGLATDEAEAIELQQKLIIDGSAYAKFREMIHNQAGDGTILDDPTTLHQPAYRQDFFAPASGYIQAMDTYRIGLATVSLGCGRLKTNDSVDPTAGMEFLRKIGDEVSAGQVLIHCFNSDSGKLQEALSLLPGTITIGPDPATHQLILQ